MKNLLLSSAVLFILFTYQLYSQEYWEITAEIDAGNINFLAVDSSDFIFAATDSGIFRSTDNGNSWLLKGLHSNKVNSIVFDSIDNIIVGSSDGLFLSTNSGESWLPFGLTSLNVRSVSLNSFDHVFAGVYESDSSISGVYRSIDGGISYTRLVEGMDIMQIEAIGIDDNNEVYASTWGAIVSRIYHFINNGEFWNHINLPGGGIYNIVWIHPNGYIFYGNLGIWRSTDVGQTWDDFAMPVYPNVFELSSDGIIFCGTDYEGYFQYGSLFMSTDNGEDWIALNMAGTPPNSDGRSIRSLTLNSKDTVFIGTFGGDIYRSIKLVTDIGEDKFKITKSFALEQNFPNPFNPSTQIKYSLAEKSNVTLKIYDVLGNEVAILVNSNQEAGSYNINFDASNLASGLYIYTLNTGNFTSSKKMMLLK